MKLTPKIGLEEDLPPEPSADYTIRASIESTGDPKFIKPRTGIIPNPSLRSSHYEVASVDPAKLAVKESISEALEKAGVLDSLIESERNKATVRSSLKANYATIEDAVRVVAEIMRIGDTSAVKLRAAEKVLELQGINAKQSADTAINIIVDGNLNVANILNPHRDE